MKVLGASIYQEVNGQLNKLADSFLYTKPLLITWLINTLKEFPEANQIILFNEDNEVIDTIIKDKRDLIWSCGKGEIVCTL